MLIMLWPGSSSRCEHTSLLGEISKVDLYGTEKYGLLSSVKILFSPCDNTVISKSLNFKAS